MENLEGYPRIKVGGRNKHHLRYADDTGSILENKEDLRQLLDIFEEQSRKKGLELNSKMIEVMVVSRSNERPHINIFINGNKLKQRDQFKYLVSLI